MESHLKAHCFSIDYEDSFYKQYGFGNRKSKETLILTQTEKAILLKAREILNEIRNAAEADEDMEFWAIESRDNIDFLLEDAEVEKGEPKGAINVTIVI